jgi:hypothetical protein
MLELKKESMFKFGQNTNKFTGLQVTSPQSRCELNPFYCFLVSNTQPGFI